MTMRIRSSVILALVVALGGIAAPAYADPTNLVLNGSFETGDFTHWTQFGNTSLSAVTSLPIAGSLGLVYPIDGTYQAYFGPEFTMGGISQMVPTVVGDSYNISFYLANLAGADQGNNEYKVKFGTTTLVDEVNSPAFNYMYFSFVTTATSVMTGFTAFGFVQNPSYFLLDDVSVTLASSIQVVVPEPSTLAVAGVSGLLALGLGLRRHWHISRVRAAC
jgi:hypothetical protein